MPYDSRWYIEGYIAYTVLWGVQSADEIIKASEGYVKFLEQSKGRWVHLIIDDRDSGQVNFTLRQAQVLTKVFGHPRMGWLIIIGEDNRVLDFVYSALSQQVGVRYRRMRMLEDALVFLPEMDSGIPTMK